MNDTLPRIHFNEGSRRPRHADAAQEQPRAPQRTKPANTQGN